MNRRRLRPLALVAGIGGTLAVLQYLLDDRDPLVFTIPILVLTLVTLAVVALAGGDDESSWTADAGEAGLQDDGLKPLPPVTPILAGVRGSTRVLSGQLYADGPWVRIARVGEELVAITDAPADSVDAAAEAWLAEHGRRAGIEEGLLVVALPSGASAREVLAATRELHARL